MEHLILLYNGLLILIGTTSTVLLFLVHKEKKYLNPFLIMYIFFSLVNLTSLTFGYLSIGTDWSKVTVIYGLLAAKILFFKVIIFASIITVLKLFNIKNRAIVISTLIVLIILSLLTVTPYYGEFNFTENKLLLKPIYYIDNVIYCIILLSVIATIINNYKSLIIKEDRIFSVLILLFSLFGLLETTVSIVGSFKNPIVDLNYSYPEFMFSTIPYIVISLYSIVFVLKSITIRVKLPSKETIVNMGYSQREAEIIFLIVQGKSNQEIVDNLCISMATVKTHVRNIFKKAEISKRAELRSKIINI